MFLSTALEAQPPSSGEFSYSYDSWSPLISPLSANLSKAGQAWSTTATGNQKYSVLRLAVNISKGERHPEDAALDGQGCTLPCRS